MAIIWADGFDHYGIGSQTHDILHNLVGYELVGGTGTYVRGTIVRTGTGAVGLAQQANLRRNIPAKKRVGLAFAIYRVDLEGTGISQGGYAFIRQSNRRAVSVAIEPNGALTVRVDGAPGGGTTDSVNTGTLLGSTESGIFTSAAWHHLETYIVADSIVGEIEIRLNGVTVFKMVDIDTGDDEITTTMNRSNSAFTYMDDYVVWDTSGDTNNTFIGPARIYTSFPNSDTEIADFGVVGSATGYGAVNEASPDMGTSYIHGGVTGDASEFGIQEMPPETEAIIGVFVPTLAKLGGSGSGGLRGAMVSDSVTHVGIETPLTAAYFYHGAAYEVDPATGQPWTKEALALARVRVEKID